MCVCVCVCVCACVHARASERERERTCACVNSRARVRTYDYCLTLTRPFEKVYLMAKGVVLKSKTCQAQKSLFLMFHGSLFVTSFTGSSHTSD